MKFNIFSEALVALSLISSTLATPITQDSKSVHENARQVCELKVQWISNWPEAGMRRYRVQLITSPRNDDHLTLYVNAYAGQPQGNKQAFWEDGRFLIDNSYAEGSAGHSWYRLDHNKAAERFSADTNCAVVLNI